MCDDDSTGHAASRCCSPGLYGWSQLRGTVGVAVEQNENSATVRLQQGEPDCQLDLGLLHQLITSSSDRPSDADLPGLSFFDQATQQYRERGNVPVPFDDRLDHQNGRFSTNNSFLFGS